jgi:hypothetical protein
MDLAKSLIVSEIEKKVQSSRAYAVTWQFFGKIPSNPSRD